MAAYHLLIFFTRAFQVRKIKDIFVNTTIAIFRAKSFHIAKVSQKLDLDFRNKNLFMLKACIKM